MQRRKVKTTILNDVQPLVVWELRLMTGITHLFATQTSAERRKTVLSKSAMTASVFKQHLVSEFDAKRAAIAEIRTRGYNPLRGYGNNLAHCVQNKLMMGLMSATEDDAS